MDTENTRIKVFDSSTHEKQELALNCSTGSKLINSHVYKEFQHDDPASMSDESSDSDITTATTNAMTIDDLSNNTASVTASAITDYSSIKHMDVDMDSYREDEEMEDNTDINSVSVDASELELEEDIDEDEKFIDDFLCFDKSSDNIGSKTDHGKNAEKYSYDQESKEVRGRPSACVFVASLSSNLDDDVLCQSVTHHFQQWGKMTLVKVLRDPANRPYAFVQYAKDEDADKAISEGQHSILNGRTVRCEKARVNRTLYLQLTNEGISEKRIEKLMARFGEVERLVAVNDNFNAIKSSSPIMLHKSWFCKFVYRQDAINAFANLKTKANWNIEWAQNLDDEYSNVPEVTIDKHSIFVGHLDPRISKEELIERFEKHGKIKEAILVNRPLSNFAFIKFRTREAAAAAVERENHSLFNHKTIHVQYREMYNNYRRKFSNDNGLKLNLAPPPVNFKKRFNMDSRPADLYKIRHPHPHTHSHHNQNHSGLHLTHHQTTYNGYRGRNTSFSEDFNKGGAPETYSQAFKMKHQSSTRGGRFNFNQHPNNKAHTRDTVHAEQSRDNFGDVSMKEAESASAGTSFDDNDSSIEIRVDSSLPDNTATVKLSCHNTDVENTLADHTLYPGNDIASGEGKREGDADHEVSTMRSNATFSSAGPKTGYTYSSIDNESEGVNMQMVPPMNGTGYQYPYYYYYPTKDMPYMNSPMHPMNTNEHDSAPPASSSNAPYYYPYGNYPPPSTPNGQMPVYPMYVYYKPVSLMDHNGEGPHENAPLEPHNEAV